MTSHQIFLVRDNWSKVAPITTEAARLFYARLFELNPSLKPLFTTDLVVQGEKLMSMIGLVVRGLDQLDQLVPAVRSLGQRHAGYGVKDEDYATVGEALLWTLKTGLGPEFTNEHREAWTTAYGVLATTMQAAAHGSGS